MLVYLGICAVICLLGAVASAFLAVSPASTFHLAFAGGAMPLVFGAVIHFVPVLTRTGSPHRAIAWLPVPVQLAGLLAALALGGWLPYASLHAAALIASVAAVVMVLWIGRRLRATLGSPHPGARWYGAAMLCLFFAVSLVPVWLGAPGLRTALRLFHLHLNTLGFIGLATLGTLPVLLPTAFGQTDPQAAARLRSDLLPALSGALLLAAGAAGAIWLAVMGAVLLGWVALRNLRAWQNAFGLNQIVDAGRTAPLVAATLGLVLLLSAGLLHAFGAVPSRPAIAGFLALFLMPLVTGALAHLLPVWRHPGRDSARRRTLMAGIAWGGQVRAALFLIAGGLLLADQALGWGVLLAGVLFFVLVLIRALFLDSRAPSDDNPRPPSSVIGS